MIKRMRSAATIAFGISAVLLYGQSPFSEYTVESAYLFNFGKFVRFSSPDAVNNRPTFDICIVGDDPFGHTLDDVTAHEQIDGKRVRAVRFKTAVEARACSIAYISSAEGSRLGADLESLRGQPVLTVSDSSAFLQHGGMIQFIVIGNHVRFAVNLDAARNAQVSLSSELLKVAVSVNGKTSAGVQP